MHWNFQDCMHTHTHNVLHSLSQEAWQGKPHVHSTAAATPPL